MMLILKSHLQKLKIWMMSEDYLVLNPGHDHVSKGNEHAKWRRRRPLVLLLHMIEDKEATNMQT